MAVIRNRELIGDGEIPIPLIANCIKEHQSTLERLNNLDNYYLGKHAILNRKKPVELNLPNNKLVANHAKYITDVAIGYFIGDPVKYEGVSFDKIKDIFEQNDITSHDTEMAKDLSVYGEGRELYYMSSDSSPIPKATVIDPRNILLVVDDTVEYKSMFGVHYYEKKDIENNAVGFYINVYTQNQIIKYESDKLESNEYLEVGREEHFFGGVPIVEFWNNEERQGDFEQQISLIDAYNVLMSDRLNDKEQLVDALLMISGATLGDTMGEASETAKRLKELKILELPSEAKAQWLIKNLNETEVEVLKKAIRDDIHAFSLVPNLTDENFASNASGVAMKYKLFGLEQLATIKERYFKQGLRERIKLFANVLKVKAQDVNVSDVKITMTRSLPSNDVEVAGMISQLRGSVSDQTLVGQLSFVDDVETEMKQLNAQRIEDTKRKVEVFGMPFEDVKDDDTTE